MMLLKAISLIWIAIVPASALQNQERERGACSVQPESFALKKRNLQVWNAGDGVLFTSGMTIDADGAPNAYGPKNRGLDLTANAQGPHGWVALVTNKQGHPVRHHWHDNGNRRLGLPARLYGRPGNAQSSSHCGRAALDVRHSRARLWLGQRWVSVTGKLERHRPCE